MVFHRLQLFEFNERPEVPGFIRDSVVEILGASLRFSRLFEPVVPYFQDFIERTGATTILDLCSGSGEPVSFLIDELKRQEHSCPKFIFSDLFPNVETMRKVAARHSTTVDIITQSVDATAVPAGYAGLPRTIICAFHHFPPQLARNIIGNSIENRQGIFILEAFPRDPRGIIPYLPVFLLKYLTNPFLAERDNVLKVLFSFFCPLIPVAGLWDGLVSVFRIHNHADLAEYVRPHGYSFDWEYHEVPIFPIGKVLIFMGIPQK